MGLNSLDMRQSYAISATLPIPINSDAKIPVKRGVRSAAAGTQVHSTVMLSEVDRKTFQKLGIGLTCDPVKKIKRPAVSG